MARSREVVIKILGDSKSAERAFGSLGKATETTAQKVQRTAMGISKAVAIPFAAAALVGINELKEVAEVNAQTDAALKSTGGQANVTGKQIRGLADELQNLTAVDAEEIQSAENLLLTFTDIQNQAGKNNDIFTQATEISLDLSRALGKDLNSSAIMVGKALNDPEKGITALSRAGVQFSEDQKAVITRLVETGDKLGAQKMILKELQTQVGGSAEAYGKTFAGQVDRAKFALEDAAGSMLQVAVPVVEKLAGAFSTAAETISNLPDPVKNAGLAIAGIALVAGPTITAVLKLTSAYKSLITFMGTAKAIQTTGIALSGLSTIAGEAVIGIGRIATAFKVAAPAAIAVADAVDILNNGLEQNLARKAGIIDKVFGGNWSGKSGVVQDLGAVGDAAKEMGDDVNKSAGKVMDSLGNLGKRFKVAEQRSTGFANMTTKEFKEWRGSVDANFDAAGRAFDNLADKSKLSADQILRQLDRQIEAQIDYNKNWNTVVERAGGKGDDLVKYLTDMGMDSAGILEVLANTSDKKFNQIVADMERAQRHSGVVGRGIKQGLDPAAKKAADVAYWTGQMDAKMAQLPKNVTLPVSAPGLATVNDQLATALTTIRLVRDTANEAGNALSGIGENL